MAGDHLSFFIIHTTSYTINKNSSHICGNLFVIYSERSKRLIHIANRVEVRNRKSTDKRDKRNMQKDQNDSELIAEYYDRYEQLIYRICYAILNDSWQAEDAVQETFLKLIRYRETVRKMAENKRIAYISRTAKNIAIDMYRSNKRKSEAELCLSGDNEPGDMLDHVVWSCSNTTTQREMTDDVEDRQVLMKIMKLLPENSALILQLRVVRQLSIREIAAIMNISEATVRKRYERAVKRARKLLVKEMMLYE